MRPVNIQSMSKGEVAALFSPGVTAGAALNRLRRWIYGDPELLEALHRAGYRDGQRIYTPRQVSILFDYLVEP